MVTVTAPIAAQPTLLADLAVEALHAEARLTPKPGLVDRRGSGAHADMTLAMLAASAEALRPAFAACAQAAASIPLGAALRARIGAVGRAGETRMVQATGGVNTHRGALWALGLLTAGAAARGGIEAIVGFAAELARLPDADAPAPDPRAHGRLARLRYGAAGAAGEARAGFPHVTDVALPALHNARAQGATEDQARLDALLALMTRVDDTCLLHRGGPAGLTAVQAGAAAVLAAGGTATGAGQAALAALDEHTARAGLSPGGSADLLAAALFLDALESMWSPCRP
ncbi:triphosphoribosyl-dephospho-CoA synthase [Winogradskya humida]|uniref:triphosphoribosyl-dephospho-CoA synthase n=1 Tax=Winogradskya humida TaxID=113566 RepID=A0ABQ4A6X8_9ACTN|nr:triphosphoribosyl-dephospho-CoA synthase [Actinoplanes humidus]GIE26393.1 triphosphoribosyl-dephospho-CoA synthase MdcB [Actinoplanes humidus]